MKKINTTLRYICLFLICISIMYFFIAGYSLIVTLTILIQGNQIVDPKFGLENWGVFTFDFSITLLTCIVAIFAVWGFKKLKKSNEVTPGD